MKSSNYFVVFGDHLQPSMDFYFLDGTGIFQDNSALIYRANNVRIWFKEHEGLFLYMKLPHTHTHTHVYTYNVADPTT